MRILLCDVSDELTIESVRGVDMSAIADSEIIIGFDSEGDPHCLKNRLTEMDNVRIIDKRRSVIEAEAKAVTQYFLNLYSRLTNQTPEERSQALGIVTSERLIAVMPTVKMGAFTYEDKGDHMRYSVLCSCGYTGELKPDPDYEDADQHMLMHLGRRET